jgi:hydrogenase maturation protease
MERILIIGFGNPHRGDDGLGYRVAEQFEAMNHDPAVQVVASQELKPEMAEVLSHVDLVIFLDACSKGTPGAMRVCELAPEETPDGLFSHDLTPEILLAAAKILYGRCPEAMMISVAGENFEISARLSLPVEATLSRVFERVRELISSAKDRDPVVRAR